MTEYLRHVHLETASRAISLQYISTIASVLPGKMVKCKENKVAAKNEKY